MAPSPKTSGVPSPATITKSEFSDLLGQYPALLETISASKNAKKDQKTLGELDRFRYVDALKLFAEGKPKKAMTLPDVKALVEWKLRHGKFRPTLMNLVSSNDPNFVKSTIQEAMKAYGVNSEIPATLQILTKLKGIGPATASLLLSVHDPHRVIFFSDEAFYWLCCDSRKTSIKYNNREYQALLSEAQTLTERLEVSATDVEKVAYVLMKQPEYSTRAEEPASKEGSNSVSRSSSTKRKMPSDSTASKQDASSKRSKRTKR